MSSQRSSLRSEKTAGGQKGAPSLWGTLFDKIKATPTLPENFKPKMNPGDLPPHVPPPSQKMAKGDEITERLRRQQRRESRGGLHPVEMSPQTQQQQGPELMQEQEQLQEPQQQPQEGGQEDERELEQEQPQQQGQEEEQEPERLQEGQESEHEQEQEGIQLPQSKKHVCQNAQKPKKKRKRVVPRELAGPSKSKTPLSSKKTKLTQPPELFPNPFSDNLQHSDSDHDLTHFSQQKHKGQQQHKQEQKHSQRRQQHSQPQRQQMRQLQEGQEASAGQESRAVDAQASPSVPQQQAGAPSSGTSRPQDSKSIAPQDKRKVMDAMIKQLDDQAEQAAAAVRAALLASQQAIDRKRKLEVKQAELEEAKRMRAAAEARVEEMKLSQLQELERLESEQAHFLMAPLKEIEDLKKVLHQAQKEADMAWKALL